MNKEDKRSLVTYLIITFVFTWLFWITALFMGYNDISFLRYLNWDFQSSQQLFNHIIFRIGVYGPIIGAFLTAYIYNKKDIKDLWKRIFNIRVKLKWYLFLILIPIIINLIVVLIATILGVELQAFFNSSIPFKYIFIFFLYEILTSGLEEPGWRGFALPKLQKYFTAEKACWILGLIWAVWHYPYVIYLYSQAGLIPLIFSLAGFTMAIIGQTFIMVWFYNNTKSIFISILLHAWLNTSTTFILGDITIDNPIMGIIPALVTWGIVFVILKIYGGETLTQST